MEYKITKLKNDKGLDIDIVNIINSNNYSFSFYTYGGYCLLYTSPSPRDQSGSRMPSSA